MSSTALLSPAATARRVDRLFFWAVLGLQALLGVLLVWSAKPWLP